MDWDDFRLFLQVARSGTMTEAAKTLGVDHSTISRRMVRLEEKLSVSLFQRIGNRTQLTAEGLHLQQAAEDLEAIVFRKVSAINARPDRIEGQVRIGAPEGLGTCFLAGQLGRIAGRFPQLDIELVSLPQTYSLAGREVDIAITLDQPSSGRLFTRKLTDYTLGLYGSARYLQEAGTPGTVTDLETHSLCGYIPELLYTSELDYLNFAGAKLLPRMRSTSIIAHAEMIDSGAALGILPVFIAQRYPTLVRVVADFSLSRSYWLSVHEDLRHLTRVRATIDAIVHIIHGASATFILGLVPGQAERYDQQA